ncbi:MAG: hypothetical protein QM765_38885 [Myxococcales bacterium]
MRARTDTGGCQKLGERCVVFARRDQETPWTPQDSSEFIILEHSFASTCAPRGRPGQPQAHSRLLARCEGFSLAERREAGIEPTVEEARRAREQSDEALSELARAWVKSKKLEERAWRLARGPSEERDVETWACDSLAAATIAPWLKPQPAWASKFELLGSIVRAQPEAFEPAARVARERRALEPGERIPAPTLEGLLDAFEEAPEFAEIDRKAGGALRPEPFVH